MSDVARSGPSIVVAGAGSIGCFVGGLLARGACNVTLLLRPRVLDEISRQGLTLTDFAGLDEELSPDFFALSDDPRGLAQADIILVSVKSRNTREMGRLIAAHAPSSAVVISLQNGIGNAGILREELPGWDVRAGVVLFNVVAMGGGRFHRGTSGDIWIGAGEGHMARHLSVPDLVVHERASITALQWGKLLMNLNNGLNALAGVPLKEELSNRDWRQLMADQITEALAVLKAAEIEVKLPIAAPVPPRFLPRILRLPTFIFTRVAATMMQIDPRARSSMWEDLEAGRPTEIDELQGMMVELGRAKGIPTPVNARVAELIRAVEKGDSGAPSLSPADIRD